MLPLQEVHDDPVADVERLAERRVGVEETHHERRLPADDQHRRDGQPDALTVGAGRPETHAGREPAPQPTGGVARALGVGEGVV